MQREREVPDGGQRVVGEVPGRAEALGQVGGGIHCGLHSPIITPMGLLGNGGGYVAVDAAGEVAALDETHVVRREVVARAPVADRPLRHAGPVLAAEDDRVPGNSLVCRPPEAARVVADHRDDALNDVGADVGQVHQGHDGGHGEGVGGGLEPSPKRRAHALWPVGRLHPAHRRIGVRALVEDVDRPFGLGAEDDDDRVAAAGGHRVDRTVQPGRPVGVADQRLGLTHPAPLARGQENADRRRPGRLADLGTLHERTQSRHAASRTLRTGSAFNYLTTPNRQNGHMARKRGGCPATGPQVRTRAGRRRGARRRSPSG